MLSPFCLSVRMSHGRIGQIQLKLIYCNFSLSVCQSIYPFFYLHRRLPVRYTLSSVCLSVRLSHRWTARDSIYAITVRLSFLRRPSHGCISQKRSKLVSCNFHHHPPIRLSDHLSVSLSVFLSSSRVCRVPVRHMLSSVRPSVCLSVHHMDKSVKTRLNLISHRFQQS